MPCIPQLHFGLLQFVIATAKCVLYVHYREYPPNIAVVKARQDLLDVVKENPNGVSSLDPMKDLKLTSMYFLELKEEKELLEPTMSDHDCIRCPDFKQHVSFSSVIYHVQNVYTQNLYNSVDYVIA